MVSLWVYKFLITEVENEYISSITEGYGAWNARNLYRHHCADRYHDASHKALPRKREKPGNHRKSRFRKTGAERSSVERGFQIKSSILHNFPREAVLLPSPPKADKTVAHFSYAPVLSAFFAPSFFRKSSGFMLQRDKTRCTSFISLSRRSPHTNTSHSAAAYCSRK